MKVLNLIPMLSFQSPKLFTKFKDKEILTISPIKDPNLKDFIKCEIGSLSYVLAMIVAELEPKIYEFDIGELSGESSVGEEEIPEILEFIESLDYILVDDNALNFHFDKTSVLAFLNLIALKSGAKILGLNGEINLENAKFSELKELPNFDGAVVLKHDLDDKFVGGPYFMASSKLKDGDMVEISGVRRVFKLDRDIKGTVALLGLPKIDSYIYEIAKFSKV